MVVSARCRKEQKKAKQQLLQHVLAQDETIVALKKELEEKKQACQRVKQAEKSRTEPCKKTTEGTPGRVSFLQESILTSIGQVIFVFLLL